MSKSSHIQDMTKIFLQAIYDYPDDLILVEIQLFHTSKKKEKKH